MHAYMCVCVYAYVVCVHAVCACMRNAYILCVYACMCVCIYFTLTHTLASSSYTSFG